MEGSSRLTRAELLGLVPVSAIQPRPRPYIGDSVAASIAELPPVDAAIVREVYDFLGGLHGIAALGELRRRLDGTRLAALIQRVHALGAALDDGQRTPHLRKVYHDVRGGSLAALVILLGDLVAGEGEEDDAEQVSFLVRDHRKIIRNALPDLDPVGYSADLEPKGHDIALLCEKWDRTRYAITDESAVEVRLICGFVGSISECCMEFAALDRVLYNLINNAARFAADGVVDFAILPLSAAATTDLRFVVVNRVTPAQRARLRSDLASDPTATTADLRRIFHGGYTTGGHGIGLQICGDFITHGYGLPSVTKALDQGYLGARLLGDRFVAWFHWPGQRTEDAVSGS